MVVSPRCEKLPPQRLLSPGSVPIGDRRGESLDNVCLQIEAYVDFLSMIVLTQIRVMVRAALPNSCGREAAPASELMFGVDLVAAMRCRTSWPNRWWALLPT